MRNRVSRSRILVRIVTATIVVTATLSAQQSLQVGPPSKASPIQLASKLPRLRLSPEQRHGLALLKAAEAEAAGLQPEMRAFVLWQASHAYTRLNRARTDSVLMDAFRATLSVGQSVSELKECFDPEWCDVQFWLQKHILQEMLGRSRQVAEIQPLLSSARPQVREEMQKEFFRRYIELKEFDKARELLNQFADQDYYPTKAQQSS